MIRMDEPLDSFDPVRWGIYADNLEDHGDPARLVRRARLVARALQAPPEMVLVGYVRDPRNLQDNPYRVGYHLFVVQKGTFLKDYHPLVWRSVAELREAHAHWTAGVKRLPSFKKVIDFARGTYQKFPEVCKKHPEVVKRFYRRLARVAAAAG